MVIREERERVRSLLQETITLLCKNGLSYNSEFCIEALIGITLDKDEVFLVSIKETIKSAQQKQLEERLSEPGSPSQVETEHGNISVSVFSPVDKSKSKKRHRHGRVSPSKSASASNTPTSTVSSQDQARVPQSSFVGDVPQSFPELSLEGESTDNQGLWQSMTASIDDAQKSASPVESKYKIPTSEEITEDRPGEPPVKRKHLDSGQSPDNDQDTHRAMQSDNTNSQEFIEQNIKTEMEDDDDTFQSEVVVIKSDYGSDDNEGDSFYSQGNESGLPTSFSMSGSTSLGMDGSQLQLYSGQQGGGPVWQSMGGVGSSAAAVASSVAGSVMQSGEHQPEKTLTCHLCGLTFSQPGHKRRHMLSCHTNFRLRCPSCNRSYNRRDNLQQHVKRAHGGELLPETMHSPTMP